jgi:hypothetical protein
MLKYSIVAILLTIVPIAGSEARMPQRGSETRIAVAQGFSGRRASPQQPSEYLGHLSHAEKMESCLDVELGAQTPEALALTSSLESLWQAGRHDDALEVLQTLEYEGLVAGVGIRWHRPQPVLNLKSTDFPIDASGTASQVLLDFDPVSGNLFAVVRWGNSWSLFVSLDQGVTWSETFHRAGALFSFVYDVDMDVYSSTSAGDNVYIAYATRVTLSGISAAWIRRFSAATGAPDDEWGTNSVLSSDTRSFKEVGIAVGDTLINYTMLCSDGAILCLVGLESTGATFVGQTTSITNAARGLDVVYPGDGSTHTSLMISYVNDNDHVCLSLRARPSGFNAHYSLSVHAAPGVDKTSIAGYLDSGVVWWEYQPNGGTYKGVRPVSFEVTGTVQGQLDVLEHPGWSDGSTDLHDPLVAGSDSSSNNAFIYTTDTDIVYRERSLYLSSSWSPLVLTLNEHDFVPGDGDSFAFEWLGRGYGVAYISTSGDVYFSKTWVFCDAFESGDTSAWSSSSY